jgi:hypothetical protein
MVRALFVSVCLMAMVGCGSGGTNPARSDCDYYVQNELCPSLISCGAADYSSVGDCINFFENSGNTVLDCATVTVEYSGLSQCEADTNNTSCGYIVDAFGNATLPASCYPVFN